MCAQKTTVLMVFPKFPPSFWSFQEAVRLMGLKATMPPTGLATVASMLPEEHFDILPIVDENVEPLSDDILCRADIVMFSAMIVQRDSLLQTIRRVKKAGKTVVVGGPYATAYSQDVLSMGADHLVLGEAEATLGAFVTDYLSGCACQTYSEENAGKRSTVAITARGKPVITSTPIPRWDLLPIRDYSSLAIQFSRGCPFDCEFCDITVLYGRQSRTKTSEQMVAELDAIYQTGWRGSIFIVDDNFIGNRREVRALLPVLRKWQKDHGFPFSFFTEGSMDLAGDNLADIRDGMVSAGFTDVFCGIESTNPDVLERMHKGQNRGDLALRVQTLQSAGLEVTAGFIIGNDDDRPTVFDDLFAFIESTGIVLPMPGLLTALRGTRLYKRLEADGRLRGESLGNNTHRFQFNFDPVLDEGFLIEGYVNLLEKLFSSKSYFKRCGVLQRNRGKRPRVGIKNGTWLSATLVVLWRNLRRGNMPAFAYLGETLLRSPLSVPDAVTHMVKFEHFRKLTQQAVEAHRYPLRVKTFAERFSARVSYLKGGASHQTKKAVRLKRRYLAKAVRLYRRLDPHFRQSARTAFFEYVRFVRQQAYGVGQA